MFDDGMYNDKYLSSWRPEREKGLFRYLLKNAGPVVASVILINVVYQLSGRFSANALHESILYNAYLMVFVTGMVLLKWIAHERKYKSILAEQALANND